MTNPLPRLLLVDDEPDNLSAIQRLLRKDFEVVVADSGERAMEIVRQGGAPFDVIVSDQRMPGMSGSEFLTHVQAHDAVATRLLLTGFSDLEAVIDAVNRGHIWRYVAKPWEPEDLKQALRQAAERTRMQRALDESRVDLERALTELRARDWARERLLKILLHEVRTAPQILEGLRQLNPNDEDGPARLSFIDNLGLRLGALESDLTALLAEEKQYAALPRETTLASGLLKLALPAVKAIALENEPKVRVHGPTVIEAVGHLGALLADNTGRAPLEASLELSGDTLFVTLSLKGAAALLPNGLAAEKLEPKLAWPLLLEPFVGAEDFRRHSKGLRVETARYVRALWAQGVRAEFHVAADGRHVELVCSFKVA